MADEFVLPPMATRRVDEVAYARAQNHERYRTITRYFHREHQRLRDWLAPREVFQAVRRVIGTDYTEQDCEADIESLREWGNLVAQRDESNARSLSEFYRSRFVYHISQFTVEFEDLLQRHEGEEGTSGSLNATLLDRMWIRLEHLRQVLERPLPDPLPPELLAREIQQPWSDVLAAFTELRDSAVAYHHTLSAVRPTDLARAEAFRIYKDTILDHLRGFITQLQLYSPKIRTLLAKWQAGAGERLLLRLLTEHDRVHKVSRLGANKLPMTLPEIHDQVHAVGFRGIADWFAAGGGCEFLYSATANAILGIARQNERFATRHLVGISRRRDLERLARAFAALEAPEDAHRLAARAFGAALPRHLRGATGSAYLLTDRASVWRQPPQEQPLRRIRRGRPSTASVAPVQNKQERLERMRQEEEALVAHERALWSALFTEATVALDQLEIPDPLLRTRMLDVIAKCMLDPDRVALASDGRRVQLTVPEGPWTYGEIVAPDGTIVLPRFVLTLMADEQATAPAAIGQAPVSASAAALPATARAAKVSA